ncbi:MAG: sodium ion-translocating decarboxylase subunit beta, partial [Erysipelotrichia bacterium]|nr:sodium ion-translocating decarboxylase subunit beta [Erysipelotrichia bacterium]
MQDSGVAGFFADGGWRNLIMNLVACVFLFLAIKKDFEPYLLLPIAFGMLLVNLPYVANEIFVKGTTTYNAITLAANVGITNAQSEFIFAQFTTFAEQLGFTISDGQATTAQLHKLMLIPEFQAVLPTGLGLNVTGAREVINGIEHLYSYDYSGIFGYLYYGVKWGIYPCLIFLCIGATTDFGPLIANKKTMFLGAAAQIGIFIAFIGAIALGKNGLGWTQFDARIASSISIIGGADGPTTILVTSKLAPEYLSSIAVVAYSYMALVPVIQPPIIRVLTSKEERLIKMENPREVSKIEKVLFPIAVTIITVLIVPSAGPLIGCLMLGNLIKESGVVPKITETLANSLMYIVTIILGVCVGCTADAETFLTLDTIIILLLGIVAFSAATAAGLLGGKLMSWLSKGKINPMIGAAGVSAVPMAARVVHKEGIREDPTNFLMMHAMGPNVAGIIGSAVAAGVLLLLF